MWSNDIECKYMFMFPLKNLARKGLNITFAMSNVGSFLSALKWAPTVSTLCGLMIWVKFAIWQQPIAWASADLSLSNVFCVSHSLENNFTRKAHELIYDMCLEIALLELLPHLPEANELIFTCDEILQIYSKYFQTNKVHAEALYMPARDDISPAHYLLTLYLVYMSSYHDHDIHHLFTLYLVHISLWHDHDIHLLTLFSAYFTYGMTMTFRNAAMRSKLPLHVW